MRNKFWNAAYFCLCLLPALPCFAALEWESTHQRLNLYTGQKQTQVSFSYKNLGATPVFIKTVKPDCGCTQAGDLKTTIAPGESGKFTFRYEFGDIVGDMKRSVHIETSHGTFDLTFSGTIHDWVSLNPRMQVWKAGEANDAKEFRVQVAKGVGPVKVMASGDGIASVVTRESDDVFLIKAHPASLERSSKVLRVQVLRADLDITAEKSGFIISR